RSQRRTRASSSTCASPPGTAWRCASPSSPSVSAMSDRDAHLALIADLQERLARTRAGGGERAMQRHVERGKLPVRERIERLVDPGSPFLELSPLAAEEMYDGDAPGAGIVTGVGVVEGRRCVVVA